MKAVQFLCAVALAVVTVSALAGGLPKTEMQPGLWQMSFEMETPQGRMKLPQLPKHCITPKDVESGKGFLHQHNAPESPVKCDVKNMQNSGNHYQYTVACTSSDKKMKGLEMSMDLDMIITATEKKGTIKTVAPDGRKMTQHLHAQRIGDC